MRVADVSASGIIYSVHQERVSALLVSGDDRRAVRLGLTPDLVGAADELRAELTRTVDVAMGRVPLLREFMRGWGRTLLPPDILASPPDVLVIVPNALIHDLPLHLVLTDAGRPLGAECGIAYCSGMTLFASCTRRNPARSLDLTAWRFDEDGAQMLRRQLALRAGGVDVLAAKDDKFAALAADLAGYFDDERVTLVPDTDSGLPGQWPPQGQVHRSFFTSVFRGDGSDLRADVVCIVAHGDLDQERHQLSGLLLGAPHPGLIQMTEQFHLAGKRYRRTDMPLRIAPVVATAVPTEVLTAAELELTGSSDAELVCLLGCSAGSGRVLQADEPASMAESFLRLGTASVIAPMWDSHVSACGEWMRCFLRAWISNGKPKAIAARDATSLLMNDYGPERAGVLTLRGDWL